MRRRAFTLLAVGLFLVGAATQLSAQYADAPTWGDISDKELAMTVYEPDSAATAVVLYDYGVQELNRTGEGALGALYVYQRVKILDRPAADELGNVSVHFYHKDRKESVSGLKAQTTLPDGTVVKLKKKDFFTEKLNDHWSKITFALPNLQEGSVLEYQYYLRSERFFQPRPWYFRSGYPVQYSSYHFVNNLPFSYLYLLQGSDYMQEIPSTTGQAYQIGDMRLVIDKTKFIATNVPALRPDDYVLCPEDYLTKVRFQLYEVSYGTHKEKVMQTWAETAKEFAERDDFGGFMQRDRFSKDLTAAAEKAVDASASDTEKLQQIVDFLHRTIKPTDVRGFIPDTSPDELFAAGQADVPDLTIAGIRLFNHFGLEAYPVLTSTRDHGALLPKHVIVDQFNYLLAAVRNGAQWIFVDFRDTQLPAGWVHMGILGRAGLLLDGEHTKWVDLPSHKNGRVVGGDLALDATGKLTGKVTVRYQGYGTYIEALRAQQTSPQQAWIDRLTPTFPTAEIEAMSWEDAAATEPLTGSFEVKIEEAALLNADYMYISPYLYSQFKDNPFKSEERTFPVDFSYLLSERTVTRIAIPEGWEVVELPEAIKMTIPGSAASFQYQVQKTDGAVTLNAVIDVEALYISPDAYPQLREMMDRIEEKIAEQIVLKKV